MCDAISVLQTRLPLRLKGGSVGLQLAGPPTSAEGELRVTIHLFTLDEAGSMVDLFEIEQTLIPHLPGVSATGAAIYAEAWVDACRAVLEDRGAVAAFDDEAFPLFGVDSDAIHPLRTPDADRAAHFDAILCIHADQLRSVEERRMLHDRVMAVYGPTRRVFARLIPGPPSSSGDLTGSRLGGLPFLPEGVDYPRNPSDGQPLLLAAQIDFSELPELDGFPTHGIFQLFVRNDRCGAGVIEPDCAHVLFHAEVDAAQARPRSWFSFLPVPFADDAPGARECTLTFSLDDEMMSVKDHRLDALVAETGVDRASFEDFVTSGSGHKLGGYPYCWTGDDKRGLVRVGPAGVECPIQHYAEVHEVWDRSQPPKLVASPAALAHSDFSDVLFDVS